ncbi:MAG: AMP-binding protein [Burkholderiaceae bacterium]|nr:AMP-binding protein [Burkholderiaceae bacterium]
MIAPPMHTAASLRQTSAPALLLDWARRAPTRVALRAKRRGLYEERSWQELALRVARSARVLESLGFTRGERLAIMGDACEEWLLLDLACQSLGGITYGIYPTASASEVAFQMRDGGARIFVAEDQEYVDRILGVIDELPQVRHVLVIDATALFMLDDPRVVSLDTMLEDAGAPRVQGEGMPRVPGSFWDPASEAAADAEIEWLGERVARIGPDDPAFIVYTSGTTGHPKGALVSHGRHLAGTHNLILHYPALAHADATTVAYLPLCHVLGRDIAITLPLLGGPVPHLGESAEDLPTTLFEVAPTVLFTVPRYLQKFASQVLTSVRNATPLKRWIFERALALGTREARARWAMPPAERTRRSSGYRLARVAAFRPVLNKLGFDRLRLLISGGAPLAADTALFWQMLGVNVCEMYGQTETAGAIIAGQQGPFPQPGDVGTAAEGIELKLRPLGDDPREGELLIRSDYRFDGYWGQPEATDALFDDGWLASGDVGRMEDGRLRLVDRARDFFVTAGGKTLSPTAIENAVRGSRFVSEVVAIGHARRFVSALVEIDEDAVADWARAHGVLFAGFTDLTRRPEVISLIQGEIDRANETLARVEQIKRFSILPKTLDPEEEGEPVTPTRKVKRQQMIERFSVLVDAMYGSTEEEMLQRAVGS